MALAEYQVWNSRLAREVLVLLPPELTSRCSLSVVEPGDVCFGMSRAEPGAVRFTRLAGTVLVSGDVSFAI